MSYLKQAQDAYRRLQAGQRLAAAAQTPEAIQCKKSELSEKSPVLSALLPPIDHDAEHAGGVKVLTGPACWACRRAVYWIRRKEVGGGIVCATCHPPHHAVQQGWTEPCRVRRYRAGVRRAARCHRRGVAGTGTMSRWEPAWISRRGKSGRGHAVHVAVRLSI